MILDMCASVVFLAQSEPRVALPDLLKIGKSPIESLERALHMGFCISMQYHQPIRKELTLCSVARLGEASGIETMIQLSLCLTRVLLIER